MAFVNVFGLGCSKALNILSRSCVSIASDFASVNEYRWLVIYFISVELVNGSERIKRIASTNINKLKDLNLYRGLRHATCRPVRGQRSRTNANTQRAKGSGISLLSLSIDNDDSLEN